VTRRKERIRHEDVGAVSRWPLLVPLAWIVGCVSLGLAACATEAQTPTSRPVLQCFHGGAVVESAPRVESFLLRQQGTMLEARWINPTTHEEEILVTTLPCLYRVTNPPAGLRPAV
jgi:hypothetical protein